MTQIFELYDGINGQHLSYHASLNGALQAMQQHLKVLTPALCMDYEDDSKVEFQINYEVRSCEVVP